MKEVFARLNRIEIKIRRAVNSQHHGNFKSIFKGSGLEFSDLRVYQYGDDVRSIDWISTAKGQGAYVKVFREEKEQNIFFLLDVSASQEVGMGFMKKIDLAKEVVGVLALSAIKETAQVGLYCFSDKKELYIKPERGLKHAFSLISRLYKLRVTSKGTSLSSAILFAMKILMKKSIIILVSDFKDKDYLQNLKALAKKHELVVIQIFDSLEKDFPSLGIIPIKNGETGKVSWVNTSLKSFRENVSSSYNQDSSELEASCRSWGAPFLSISSEKNLIPKLIELFRVR